MTTALLAVAELEACDAAEIPREFGAALIWRTKPIGAGVTSRQWRAAREVLAAELVAHGLDCNRVAELLDATAAWVAESHQANAERFAAVEHQHLHN